MSKYFQSRIFSIVAVLLPSASLLASPSDVYQTQTTLHTLGYAETNSYDSGLVGQPTSGSIETSTSVVYGSTLATASGRASAGDLGVSALAVTSQANTAGIVSASATAQAAFNDSITLSSSNLALGTPVDVEAFITLEGTPSEDFPSDSDSAYFGSVISTFGGSTISFCEGSAGNNTSACNFSSMNILHLSIGASYAVNGQLTASASSGGTASIAMDYMDTSNYYLVPLASGVTIQSASGYDYEAVPNVAAPEIGTGGLAILNVLLVSVACLRAARKRC